MGNLEFNKRVIIYYFSGTGNSFSVSQWFQRVGEQKNIPVELVNIATINRKQVHIPQDALIGIISPTHGFNFPPIMFHFLFRLPRTKANSAFIINTRAGMKMHKFFLPGLSGVAQFFSAILLLCKGYRIKGMYPIDLPSNWISLHPGLRYEVVASIYARRKKQVETFASQLLSGKSNYRALFDLIQDVLVTPIAILYYCIGRFFLSKTFYANSNCNNCNRCIEQCPVKAIRLVDGRPYWTWKCESCMQCMNNCPDQAIETAHGFAIGSWVLVHSGLLFFVYHQLGLGVLSATIEYPVFKYLAQLIFDSGVLIGCVFTGYWMVHWLMHFSFFERIMRWTSFTSFGFWRRYNIRKMKFWREYSFPKWINSNK
jgi:ferredoxin